MRVDRPTGRPEDNGEGDNPSTPERPVQEDRSRYELPDCNGLNPAEYIRAWNKKVESGEAEKEQAAEERPHRDVGLRDSNGMPAAELRFQRNQRIEEAKAETDTGRSTEKAEPYRDLVMRDSNGLTPAEYIREHNRRIKEAAETEGEGDTAKTSEHGGGEVDPPRKSVLTDAQGRTGAEMRFQQAKRAEEAATARAAEAAAGKPPEGDARPEFNRELRTVTEELGESKSWHSFSAAKREIRARLGHEPGIQVDHVVEQCQEARSGFTGEQINSSDNMVRLDGDVHKEKTRRYASHVPGTTIRLRDMLDGESWEEQHQTGMETLREEMEKRRDNTDD